MEYRKLDLGSLVKLAVDAKGMSNGSIDILSFEYDINSEIDKIVDYVEENNFEELKDQVDIVKGKSVQFEEKIKDYALEILTLQNDSVELRSKIEEYNVVMRSEYNTIVNLLKNILNSIVIKSDYDVVVDILKTILSKIEPKIIYKEKVVREKEYIQVETTYYKGVKSIDEVRKEESVKVYRSRPKQKNGWFEYSDEWMVNILFDKEHMFMNKSLYNECLKRNIPFYSLVPPRLFHSKYDKK